MPSPHEALILDLIAWLAERPRRYADVMEAWRTSCPRLPVWEDAVDRGLVVHAGGMVAPTPAGHRALAAHSAAQAARNASSVRATSSAVCAVDM